MEKIVSQSQSSLALEIKDEITEPELDLFIREKQPSNQDVLPNQQTRIIKVTGTITVSF